MKRSLLQSALFATILIVSATCFIYVNSKPTAEIVTPTTSMTIENAPVQDTKMPDLKIVKSVLDFIGKFATAK